MKNFIYYIFRKHFSGKKALWLLAPIVCLSFLSIPYAQKAMIPDNSLKVWFLEDDPKLKAYHHFQSVFGNDEVLLIHIPLKKGDLANDFSYLQKVSSLLSKVKGVFQVHSIFSLQDGYNTQEGILFAKVVGSPFRGDKEEALKLKRKLLANANAKGRLIAKDGHSLMFWLQMDEDKEFDAKRGQILEGIKTVVDRHLGDRLIAMGGTGAIYEALNKETQKDSKLFVSLGFLLMFFVMFFIFKSSFYLAATFATITTATLWTLFALGYLGHQINMVTVILPTLITVLGLCDVVHFPPAFARAKLRRPRAKRLLVSLSAMKEIFIPCLLTTLTTCLGFLSLAFAPMQVLKELGFFAAFGVMLAFFASFLFMGVCFVSLGGKKESTKDAFLREKNRFLFIHLFVKKVESLLVRYPGRLSSLLLAVMVLSGLGLTYLKADTYTISYLPKDHKVVLDHNHLEKTWGYYSPVEYLIHPLAGRKMSDAALLNAVEAFIKEVESMPEVSVGHGLNHIYRRLAKVLSAPMSDFKGPFSETLAAQLTFVLESNGFEWRRNMPEFKDNFLGPLTSKEFDIGRVTFTGKMVSARELSSLLARVDVIAKKHFAGLATLESAGYVPLYVQIIDYVMASQMKSFFFAVLFIFLLMALWLRSLSLALISLVPNLFPVSFVLGVMGFLGIHLDMATCVIAAIIVGVSIDDTVHFLYHWQKGEKEGFSWQKNVSQTFSHAGVPATITSLVLFVGYFPLIFASVGSIASFGILVAMAAVMALVADLLLLPLILRSRYAFMAKYQMPIERKEVAAV